MSRFAALIPLLTAAGILLAGNGLLGTMIALRADQEGFSPILIGVMGAAYFAGFIIACFTAAQFIRAVGHIRVFAALAAITAAGTLTMVLALNPVAWIIIRFVMGFCFSGLFMVVDSWLNESAHNEDRGRLMSIYRIVDLSAVTGMQFLIPAMGTEGYELFIMAGIILGLSLVPISLSDRSRPNPPENIKLDLRTIWAISPMACVGSFAIGMTGSAFRLVAPLYATNVGLDVSGVAIFMSAGIIGGALFQYPLGSMSDRMGRRWVLMLATACAAASGLFLTNLSGETPWLVYLGIFLFGGFSLPLYSLSAAHANDQAAAGQYVIVSAGLTFFFSVGGLIGPVIASWMIQTYGAPAFFTYTSAIHGSLVLYVVWRKIRNPGVIVRTPFVALIKTSPIIYRMARRAKAAQRRRQRKGAGTPELIKPW
ncbi:MAG: MFS transporter [Pseudomonadota bacterium]